MPLIQYLQKEGGIMSNNDEPELIMKKADIDKIAKPRPTDESFVKKNLSLNLELMKLSQFRKPESREEIQERIARFFELCDKADLPPTVEGLALATGYDRRILFDIEHQRNGMVKFHDEIVTAKNLIANYDAVSGVSNKMNSAIYAFRAKNLYGMRDVQEVRAVQYYDTNPENPQEIVDALPDGDEKFVEIKD